MARTKTTPKKGELKALCEIKHQQKQTKPVIPKVALARYKEILVHKLLSKYLYAFILNLYAKYISD